MSDSRYNDRILTKQEIEQYKAFGEIDYEQNFLELFTDEVADDLLKIKDLPDSNYDKAEVIEEYLGQYGFVRIDQGTNIFTMANHMYPGVVFKIACDDNGIADNFNDVFLMDYIPELTKVLALHSTGIVSVQERKVVLRTRSRFNVFLNTIMKIIDRLQQTFVLCDINLKTIRNFGLNKDGSVCIVDASDVFFIPDDYDIFKCRTIVGRKKNGDPVYCGHRLRYSDDYRELVCDECKRTFNPTELKRGGKTKLEMCTIHPGLNADAWHDINEAVYAARREKLKGFQFAVPEGPKVNIPDHLKPFRDALNESIKNTPTAPDESPLARLSPCSDASVLSYQESSVVEEGENMTHVINFEHTGVTMVSTDEGHEKERSNDSEESDDESDEGEVVTIEAAAETTQAKLAQRFSEVTDTDILITTDTSDPEAPIIYLATKADGEDLQRLIELKGPEVYLSVNGKNDFMKVVNAETLALMIMHAREEMIEEGTWEADDTYDESDSDEDEDDQDDDDHYTEPVRYTSSWPREEPEPDYYDDQDILDRQHERDHDRYRKEKRREKERDRSR